MIIDLDALAHPPDPVTAYLTGQRRPSQGPLLDAFAAESAATLDALRPVLDLRYGTHPRETFDLYANDAPWRGTVVYLHAGYWQSRDKAQFRFLAPSVLAHGLDLVLMNYPLCPDVTLGGLTAGIRDGLPKVLKTLEARGRGGREVVLAGHSAGAHLAVELALTDWTAHGVPRPVIRGILPISGVYELTPLVSTPLNDNLRLDAAEARRCSPVRRVAGRLPPACFVVGALETPEFRAQTDAMHLAWTAGGGSSSCRTVEAADHFGVLRALDPGGEILRAVSRMAES